MKNEWRLQMFMQVSGATASATLARLLLHGALCLNPMALVLGQNVGMLWKCFGNKQFRNGSESWTLCFLQTGTGAITQQGIVQFPGGPKRKISNSQKS